jgi:hypothetical protein
MRYRAGSLPRKAEFWAGESRPANLAHGGNLERFFRRITGVSSPASSLGCDLKLSIGLKGLKS